MSYICHLFVLRIVTWNQNCSLSFTISKLKLYTCVQTNDYNGREIIFWNHMIIIIYTETWNHKKMCKIICVW